MNRSFQPATKPAACRPASFLFLLFLLLILTKGILAQTITYSESFTGGATYSSSDVQWTHWSSFISQLTPRTYSSVTMKGSYDMTGVKVTDPVVATAIANALNAGTEGTWTSGGRTWKVGVCGSGLELSASGGICDCPNPNYIMRPQIGNANWGGINTATCEAPSQTMTVIFTTAYTFTNAGASGRSGPSQANVNSAYTGTSLAGLVTVSTQGIQEWTVPATGDYYIDAYGAAGASSYGGFRAGGLGAYAKGTFSLTAGTVLKIIVGQAGNSTYAGTSQYEGGGGGGGSFVWKSSGNVLLLAAGGGGGGGANQGTAYAGSGGVTTPSGGDANGLYPSTGGTGGNGGNEHSGNGEHAHGGSAGSGWLSDGASTISAAQGGFSILYGNGVGGQNGSYGGQSYGSEGGFGGGGGAVIAGGGGGGYSGGGAGNQPSDGSWIENGGGGGGTYNGGSNQTNTAAVRSGHGTVIITSVYYGPPTVGSFTPNSGNTGTTVTITGTNFSGVTAVSFGGTSASSYTVNSLTEISAVVGSGSSGSVSVTTGSGTGSLAGFTFNPVPADPTGITVSENPVCGGFPTQLTASGAVGTVYWYTGSCGGTLTGTGNPLTVSPTLTTTYYARNYNGSQYSSGCTWAEVTVSPPSFVPTTRTVADLQATGSNIKWYASSTGGSPLLSTTALVSGNHYYASQTLGGVESLDRLDVIATLDPTPCKPTGSASQVFSAGATVASLAATGSNIRWYSTSSGETALSSATVLVNGAHYYATQTVSCTESSQRLDVVVTIN
ncbi:MAG TPA: hypothetical protein PKG48_05275 [Bacteroidales bacterium]|nr:hypothetical protein [Bacteroidales bacterium]HPS61976.1 hypothetical protein [Bacteroidales bacterium]